jgi:hypothetical protein
LSLEKLINEKYFPVKEKFGIVSRKVFFLLAVFAFLKMIIGKPLSKLYCVCLLLEKLVNRKYFQVKEKFRLDFQESVFLKKLGRKHFPKIMKNIEMSLFTDYIKFDPQTFDCYI